MMKYILIRKKNNRRMYLRYKDGEIIVTAPYRISKKDIDRFVEMNRDWIYKQQNKEKINCLKDGSCIHILNEPYVLKIDSTIKRASISSNVISIKNQKDFDSIFKKIATPILEEQFVFIQKQLNIQNMNMKVGIYSKQWGSCNKMKRDIHLNAYLILTELSFIQAVICHEFAHMYVSNHSKDFYDVLCTWMPNYKSIHKKYKNYQFPRIEVLDD